MDAQVRKMDGLKSGKGFSLSEVRKAGLSIYQVKKLGVYIDPRRRTLHEFNVHTLQTLIQERQRQLEEEAQRKMEREEVEEKEEKKKKKKEKKEKKKEVKKKEEKKPKKKEEKKEIKEVEKRSLTEIKGVGKKRAETLEAAGISTVEDLLKADTEELAEKTGYTPEYIEKLKENARSL